MEPGVTIYGGFDATWAARATGSVTEIDAASPVVTFDQIHLVTALDHVTVKSDDATACGGASSFAIVVTSSSQIEPR